ncbi:MAG: hypothetical protein H0U75_03685 [Legionella sp.]|nr:hypothetical protein [Legionella sp.]
MFAKTSSATHQIVPSVPYNQEMLDEVVIEFSENIQAELQPHLADIKQQFSIVNDKSQSVEAIQAALIKIESEANIIFATARHARHGLADVLKNVILEWIAPVNAALKRHTFRHPIQQMTDKSLVQRHEPLPMLSDEDLEIRTKFLYAEQSFIARQQHLHAPLIKLLRQLKALFKDESEKPPQRCHIVYAAPTSENNTKEYWVEPFLGVLYEHLTAAGIRVVMGNKDLNPEDSVNNFMQQYKQNDIIFIGTESLKKRDNGYKAYQIQSAIAILLDLPKDKVCPLLISGRPQSTFPNEFGFGSNVKNAHDGYIATLKCLIDWLFKVQVLVKKEEYENLWKTYIESQQKLVFSNTAINVELSFGFHKQSSMQLARVTSDIRILNAREESFPTIHNSNDVTQLFQTGMPIDFQGKLGNTLLMTVIKDMSGGGVDGYATVVTQLVSLGANLNLKNELGKTALSMAFEYSPLDSLAQLTNSLQEIKAKRTAQAGELEEIEEAIEHNINHSSLKVIKILLENGASFSRMEGDNFYEKLLRIKLNNPYVYTILNLINSRTYYSGLYGNLAELKDILDLQRMLVFFTIKKTNLFSEVIAHIISEYEFLIEKHTLTKDNIRYCGTTMDKVKQEIAKISSQKEEASPGAQTPLPTSTSNAWGFFNKDVCCAVATAAVIGIAFGASILANSGQ